MVEVELKAHIDNFEVLARRLEDLAGKGSAYVKEDLYFSKEGGQGNKPVTAFRLRNENGRWIVTAKKKVIEEGIEVSRENEFEVSSSEEFLVFAQDLGYQVFIKKTKRGQAYSWGPIKAELSRVEHLGAYLELEILLPEDCSEEEILGARENLMDALGVLGLSSEHLEPRPYTQMLMEKKQNTGGADQKADRKG